MNKILKEFYFCKQEVTLEQIRKEYYVAQNGKHIKCKDKDDAEETYYRICGRIANACAEIEKLVRFELKDELAQARLENMRLKMELKKLKNKE